MRGLVDHLKMRPETHPEFVQACIRMAHLVSSEGPLFPTTDDETTTPSELRTPLDWLNEAIAYAPDSAEALAQRARLHRAMAGLPGTSEQDKRAQLQLARRDLDTADNAGIEDPRVRFFLGAEWMALGELDRAAAQVRAIEGYSTEDVSEQFLDTNDWLIAKYQLASELAARKGDALKAAALADEILASQTQKMRRVQVLPSAIQRYVMAGRAGDARTSLDEYRNLLGEEGQSAESTRRLAALDAMVAGAENDAYAIIEALEPAMVNESANSRLWRLLAEAYNRTGQAGRAVKSLEQYRRMGGQDPLVLKELAKQYSKLGQWQQASDTAAAVESLSPDDLLVKLLRLGASLNLIIAQDDDTNPSQIEKLAAELAGLRQEHPEEVTVRVLQAIVAGHLGQTDEAEAYLKQAIEQCPDPLKAEMQLANYYLSSQRTAEASDLLEAACKRHPEATAPRLSLVDVYVGRGDFDAARRCVEEGLATIAEAPAKRTLSLSLALLEMVHGDRAKGIDLLRQLAAQDPREIQARSLLLRTGEIQENPAAAQALIGELKQAEGDTGLRWRFHQASLWLASEDWASHQAEIADALLYCIEADPAWSAPILLLARLHERLGDLKGMEDTYRRGLLGNPSAMNIASRLLALLERQGRFADAEKVLGQIEVDSRVANTWEVRMALGAGDNTRAIDTLKTMAADDEGNADARIQLGRLVYQQTKDAEQALAYLEDVEATGSNARTVAAVKASILRDEGKEAEALQILDDYVADHNEPDAYWMRAIYHAEAGRIEQAEQDYSKILTFPDSSAAGYGLLANFYANSGRLDQGLTTVEAGLKEHPEATGLKRTLMQLLLTRNRDDDRQRGLEILAELQEQLPDDNQLVMIRAAETLKQPTPQALAEIRKKIENIVRRQPTDVGAHLMLINVAMRERQYQAACSYAVQALESNPNDPTLLSARSRAEMTLGYIPMAVKLARQAIEIDPNNAEAVTVIGEAAVTLGQTDTLEEARGLLGAALGRYPADGRLQILQARVLASLDRSDEAIGQLEAYCQSAPGQQNVLAMITLADLYRLKGNADRADQYVKQAETLAPNDQAVIHARFLWLLSQNRLEAVAGISEKYLSATGQDPVKLLGAGSVLMSFNSADRKKEAVLLFERAVDLAPAAPEPRINLASGLYQIGDVERSEKVYRDLLALEPDDIRALNDLAWILQKHKQQYTEALELADKGLRLAPNDPHLLDTRGTILANMPDRLTDAKSDFENLAKLSAADKPQYAKALLQLGRVSAKLGDVAETRRYLEDAMSIDQELGVLTPGERSEISELVKQESTP